MIGSSLLPDPGQQAPPLARVIDIRNIFPFCCVIRRFIIEIPALFGYNAANRIISFGRKAMKQLDKTDRAIISHLQIDGRMPFTKIAAKLEISEGGGKAPTQNEYPLTGHL